MNCQWITKTEAAERLGVTSRRIDYLCQIGKLEDNGQKGRKRKFKFESEGGKDDCSNETKETLEEAKRRKMIADANLAELRHKDEQERLFNRWTQEYTRALKEALAPFHKEVSRLRLSQKQAEKLTEIFKECLDELQNKSDQISAFQDI